MIKFEILSDIILSQIQVLFTDLSLINLRRTVQPQINVTVEVQKGLQNVQHLRHLRENQNSVSIGFEFS